MEDDTESSMALDMQYSQQVQAELLSHLLDQQVEQGQDEAVARAIDEGEQAQFVLGRLDTLVQEQPQLRSHQAITAVMEHFAERCGVKPGKTALESIDAAMNGAVKRQKHTGELKRFVALSDADIALSLLAKTLSKKLDGAKAFNKSTPIEGTGRLCHLNPEMKKVVTGDDVVALMRQIREESSNSIICRLLERLKKAVDGYDEAMKGIDSDLSPTEARLMLREILQKAKERADECVAELMEISSAYQEGILPARYRTAGFTLKPAQYGHVQHILFQIHSIVDLEDEYDDVEALVLRMKEGGVDELSSQLDTFLRLLYDILTKRALVLEACVRYAQLSI